MLECDCLAVDFAAVEVVPDGEEADAASCSVAAVAQEVDQNLCTCPSHEDFGDPPANGCNFHEFLIFAILTFTNENLVTSLT